MVKAYTQKAMSLQANKVIELLEYIDIIQPIRNEATHGETTSILTCNMIRQKIIGIGENGILCELLKYKHEMQSLSSSEIKR